jgi:hypothetical protein
MNSDTIAPASSAASTSTLHDTPTPEQLLSTIRDVQERIKLSTSYLADLKEQLSDHYAAGNISDSFTHHGITATLIERKGNWEYSSAVDNLKTLEEAEGIATRKLSSFFWTIKAVPSS